MNKSWEGRGVLVTGAGGFIGSHLVQRLVHQGAAVRAFVRYTSRGDIGLLRMLTREETALITIESGDLRDAGAVSRAVEGVEFVFHLGASISIPYSYRHPVEVAETNVLGTLNVLMACKEHGIGRLVHVSSSEVYGTAREVPMAENHVLQGQSPYSATKIGADKLAESFTCAFGLPVVTIRPFNTYGPRQSARAVIPTIITQALTQGTVRLGRLDTSRDFTFVSDTVSGLECGAQAEGVEGMTFNLGTGECIAVGELAHRIIGIIGRQVEVVVDPTRLRPEKSEVVTLVSDNRSALERLAWRPEVPLNDGLHQTVGWVADHLDEYRVGEFAF
jgi:NAD dependent epimerase/dehydratase